MFTFFFTGSGYFWTGAILGNGSPYIYNLVDMCGVTATDEKLRYMNEIMKAIHMKAMH